MFSPSLFLSQSFFCLHLFLLLPYCNPMTFIIHPSHPASLFPPPTSLLSFCTSIPLSFTPFSNRPPLSGNLAEAKCFLLSLCRWDCNKACQWEVWVALSHALCLPSVNSLLHLSQTIPPIHASPLPPASLSSKDLCFYFSSLICLPFLPCFVLLLHETVLLDLSLKSLSLWFPCQRHFQEHDEEEQQQKTPPLIYNHTHAHTHAHTHSLCK